MKRLLLLLAILLVGCGPKPKLADVEKGLRDDVQKYEQFYDVEIDHIPVEFRSFEDQEQYLGVCTWDDDGASVAINDDLKGKMVLQRIVVFHELGHCKHGLTHQNGTTKIAGEEIRRSLMHPHVVPPGTYRSYHTYYHSQLGALIADLPVGRGATKEHTCKLTYEEK